MTAAIYPIVIEKYSSFLLNLTWKDSAGVVKNLTGYTGALEVRYNYDDVDPAVEAVVTLGGVLGTVAVEITDEDTATLTAGKALYDLVLTSAAGQKFRIIQGPVRINEGVTQP